MSEHCGCEPDFSDTDYAIVDHRSCRYPALLAEVKRLRAFVREKCGPKPNVEFEEAGPDTICMACGEEDSAHEPDCLWVACAIDPKLSER